MIESTDGVLKEIDTKLNELQQEFSVVETDLANLQKRREQIRGEYTSLLNLRQKIAGNSENQLEPVKCQNPECENEGSTTCEEECKYFDENAKEIVVEENEGEPDPAEPEVPELPNISETKHEDTVLSEEDAKKIEEIKRLKEQTPEYLQ